MLLARARVAQAEFDLANAQLFVQQGQANLALAIGVAANAPFAIESLQSQHVPQSFGSEVEQLIAEAMRQRPDLAAQVATLNARQAGIDRARAAFSPTVDAHASYGEQLWNFQFGGPFTQKPMQPQYAGQLALSWDLFTGFQRLNQLRQAEAERDLANARFTLIQSTADLLTASAAVAYTMGAIEPPRRP